MTLFLAIAGAILSGISAITATFMLIRSFAKEDDASVNYGEDEATDRSEPEHNAPDLL